MKTLLKTEELAEALFALLILPVCPTLGGRAKYRVQGKSLCATRLPDTHHNDGIIYHNLTYLSRVLLGN